MIKKILVLILFIQTFFCASSAQQLIEEFKALQQRTDLNANAQHNLLKSDQLFVHFGFKYCAPCRVQLKALSKLAKEYRSVHFVYISFDEKDELIQEAKEVGIFGMSNFSLLTIDKNSIKTNFGINGYPSNFCLKCGRIISNNSGTKDEAGAEINLKKMLTELKKTKCQ